MNRTSGGASLRVPNFPSHFRDSRARPSDWFMVSMRGLKRWGKSRGIQERESPPAKASESAPKQRAFSSGVPMEMRIHSGNW